MEEQFDRASECERRLQELLHLNGDDPIQRGLLTAVVDRCEQETGPKNLGTFEISLGRWVLRTDDLNVCTAMRKGAVPLLRALCSHFELCCSEVRLGSRLVK